MRNNYICDFEKYIETFSNTYQVQGMIVGIFDDKELLYENIVGYRDVERRLPIDRDTIFGIASITKSFTVIALLQLVSQGIIDLDKAVSDYFPNWTLSEDHTPTVKQLLSHAGGFYPQERFLMTEVANDLSISLDQDLSKSKELSKQGAKLIVDRINKMSAFNGIPGENFSYSNFSFGLLTDLVERYSPYTSYAEALKEGVLTPMGLENTFLDFNRTLNEVNITRLYTVGEQNIQVTDDYKDLGFVLLGGGGLKSTFNDLMAYTRFYMNNGLVGNKQLLSAKLLGEMTKSQLTCKPHQAYGYGLSVGNLETIEYVGHSGGLTGVSSFFAYSKASGKGVVVLCNTGNVPVTSVGIAALRLANDEFPDYKISSFETATWSKSIVAKTVGHYKSEEGDEIEIFSSEKGIGVVIADKVLTCRIIGDDALLIQNKMEENYCRIFRAPSGYASAVTLGSRIVPRKMI